MQKFYKTENDYFIFDNPIKSRGEFIHLKIYNAIRAMCYRIRMMLIKPKVYDKRYSVSVCAIFKNEASYLREWIMFNKIVGVDHFYLYNNNSNDNYFQVLKPFVDCGLVTLNEWPQNQKQMECYVDCIEKYRSETKWLGFIDIDEFIVPKSTNTIYDFLREYENTCGAVNIYWKLFGTSGLITRDFKGLVTEKFVVCWPKYCDIGKCFYNTAYDFDRNSYYVKNLHHRFWARLGGKDIPCVNVFNHVCCGNRNVANSKDFPVQINHYFTKSYMEYADKKNKGDVYFVDNPHDEEYFYKHEMLCTDVDYSAYKYIVRLKMELEKEWTG